MARATAGQDRLISGPAAQRWLADRSGADRWIAQRGIDPAGLSYDLNFENRAAGVERLPAEMTIEGVTRPPEFRYWGYDASAAGWDPRGYGSTLALAGTGADPTYRYGDPALGRFGDSDVVMLSNRNGAVRFPGAKAFDSAPGAVGQIDTRHFVVEFVLNPLVFAATNLLFGTRTAGLGWDVRRVSSNLLAMLIQDGAGSQQVSFSSLLDLQWIHGLFIGKRDGSLGAYFNGVAASGSASIATHPGTLTNANPFSIGRSGGSASFAGNVAVSYAALYLFDDLSTHAQAALAKDRAMCFWGFDPDVSQAATSVTKLPEVYTRATAAFVQKQEYGAVAKMYYCAAGWPRVDSRRTEEEIHFDDFLGSEDLNHASWTSINALANPTTGEMFRGREVQAIVADGTDAKHGFSQSVTVAAQRHIAVVTAKAGAKDAIRIETEDADANPVVAQFDLALGTIGVTSGANILAKMKLADYKLFPGESGFYDCEVSYDGGSGAHDVEVLVVEDATIDDATYTGDGASDEVFIAETQHDRAPTAGLKSTRLVYVKTVDAARAVGRLVRGYLSEPVATNLVGFSDDFGSWSKFNITVVNNATPGPWPGRQMQVIREDDTDPNSVNFFVGRTVAVETGKSYVLSTWAKAANRNWLRLFLNDGPNTPVAFFNLTTGLFGTVAPNVDGFGAYDYGNGIFRPWIRVVSQQTGSTVPSILVADADNSVAFVGLGQDSVYLYGAMVHEGQVPVSHIITPSSVVATRNADVMYYKGDDGVINNAGAQGRMVVDFWLPNHDNAAGYLLFLSDGGSSTKRIGLLLGANTNWSFIEDSVEGIVHTNQVGPDSSDGLRHRLEMPWGIDFARMLRDGAQIGAVDLDVAAIPGGLDRVHIGTSHASIFQPGGALLRRQQVFKKK